jgi:hypothetical protein
MHDPNPTAPREQDIVKYTGIYNADGGIIGEARYVIGHLLGTTECALCDITHSPIRRKPEWDRFAARLSVPIVVLHRNELDDELAVAISAEVLPVVVAHHANGSIQVALDAERLAQLDGSVAMFETALLTRAGHP